MTDVSSLFTNVPVDETIEILAEKAFKDDWFNKEYDLNITKADLIELLEIATKNQLFVRACHPLHQGHCLLHFTDTKLYPDKMTDMQVKTS